MKLRNREKTTVTATPASSSRSSSASGNSSSTASFVASSTKRAGKGKPSTRGRKAARKVLNEKNGPSLVEENVASAVMESMSDIFQKCQHLQYQDECIKKLRDIYHATNHKDFCAKLSQFIKIILLNDPRSPFTKHCIQFIPKLINTLDNEKRGIELKADETVDELAESIFGEEIFSQVTSGHDCVLDYVLSELLLKTLESVDTKVRQNTCRLILRLLHGVNYIRNDVYILLQASLLTRLADRNYLIRALSAYCLRRFQDTSRTNDPIAKALTFHLNSDPAFQVRLAVLSIIEGSPETLHFIIKKTRDVKAVVRKQAFIKIADQITLSSLSPEQRILILKEGLNDRHPNVRKVVEEKLLTSWLKQCNDDIVVLLSQIDVKSELKTSTRMLDIFANHLIETGCDQFGTKFHSLVNNFRQSYLDHEKLLIEEHLTPEKVFIWQCLNTFIKSNEDKFIKLADKKMTTETSSQPLNENLGEAEIIAEEWANQTLTGDSNQPKDDTFIADYLFPELPHICQYLQKFVDSIDSLPESVSTEELVDKEFVYNQLVSILLLYDICDEAQQNYILEMIRSIIFSPKLHVEFQDSISPIMKFIAVRIFKDSAHLLEFTAECTSKVYNLAADTGFDEAMTKSKTPEPSHATDNTYDVDYARLTVEIEEYRDQLDKAVADQDYMVAQNMKNKLDELNSERERLNALRMQQKSTQSQQVPQSQVPPQQPFNLQDHPDTLLKCLQIFVGALEHGKFDSANALIFSHIENIVLPGVLIKVERIRTVAVKALGLSCFLSDSLFQEHSNLMLQILKYDSEPVKIIALHSFFDCLCKHGLDALLKSKKAPDARRSSRKQIEEDIANLSIEGADPELLEMSGLESIGDAETQADLSHSMMEDEEEANVTVAETTIAMERSRYFETLNKNSEQEVINSLIEVFTARFFNSGIEREEESAIQGFAKLMILGVIYSPPLLSRLIITWYLPETRPNIMQFLGIFIPIYVGSESKYVREDDHITVTGQTCLVDCFIDTLEILFEAKYAIDMEPDELRLFQYLPNLHEDAQYRQIDLKNVMSFMFNLVKPSQHKNLLSNLVHKMFTIVTSTEQEYRFYEDFLNEYLLKATLRLSLDDLDDTVFGELRPVMIKIITKMKSRIDNMRSNSRKRPETFIRSFLAFYKSLGRGELNTSASRNSDEMEDDAETVYDDDLNLDPLGSMPASSDDYKENDAESDDDKEKDDDNDEEVVGEDDGNDDVDSLSDVSETLKWSDDDEAES